MLLEEGLSQCDPATAWALQDCVQQLVVLGQHQGHHHVVCTSATVQGLDGRRAEVNRDNNALVTAGDRWASEGGGAADRQEQSQRTKDAAVLLYHWTDVYPVSG